MDEVMFVCCFTWRRAAVVDLRGCSYVCLWSAKSMRSHREVFPGKAIILTGARSENWPYYFVFSLLFPHSRNFCFSTWTTAPQITFDFDFMGCWRSWHAETRLCVLSRTFFSFFFSLLWFAAFLLHLILQSVQSGCCFFFSSLQYRKSFIFASRFLLAFSKACGSHVRDPWTHHTVSHL